jgi:hypothetical protein
MSWNPFNQPPVGGAVNPNFSSANVGQVNTGTTDVTAPAAPNRAQMITATAVPHPTAQTPEGAAQLQTVAPDYSGIGPGGIAFARWW